MHGTQLAVAAQRIVLIAMRQRAEMDMRIVPRDHRVEQAHRAMMRDQVLPIGFSKRRHLRAFLAITIDRQKWNATPSATVAPIARSTGTLEVASRPNTSTALATQTTVACSVRRASAASSTRRSKNSA